MNDDSLIYVAGHDGLVGSAIMRALTRAGLTRTVTRTIDELDLREQADVRAFFEEARPEYVILAAARVGGIKANSTYPAWFISDNLQIQTHVIDAAWRSGVRKLLFLGSSCIYPRLAPQPMKEEHLLTSQLEETNKWYAIAKIAGIMMCQAYRRQYGFDAISAMPTNLYGPGDNFHRQDSHVIPALMRRIHEAHARGEPAVGIWGTGTPRREFLHVDDLADALVFLLRNYSEEQHVNIGTGADVTIAELATLITETVGYQGELTYGAAEMDGVPRKLLDTSRINGLGWTPTVELRDGLRETYRWFLENEHRIRREPEEGSSDA